MGLSTPDVFHTQDEELRGVDLSPENHLKIEGALTDAAMLKILFEESGENRGGVEAILGTE